MAANKNVSRLSEHKLYRKQGKVVTPLNEGLGEQLTLSSWARERMPEYLWLGLILMEYGRKTGFEKIGKILFDISQQVGSLLQPQLSKIFALLLDEQRALYKIILREIEPSVLSPLTVLYQSSQQPEFNLHFNLPSIRFETRLRQLNDAIRTYYSNQSNEATDLRFLSLSFLFVGDRLKIASHLTNTIESLSNYPYTSHDDERDITLQSAGQSPTPPLIQNRT